MQEGGKTMQKVRTEAEIIAARRAYKKAWRDANKDKVREYNRRFYAKLYDKLESEKGLKPEKTE